MRFLSWTVPARELIVWLETCQLRSRLQNPAGAGEEWLSIAGLRLSQPKRDVLLVLMQSAFGMGCWHGVDNINLLTVWVNPLLSWLRASWFRPPYDTGNQHRA